MITLATPGLPTWVFPDRRVITFFRYCEQCPWHGITDERPAFATHHTAHCPDAYSPGHHIFDLGPPPVCVVADAGRKRPRVEDDETLLRAFLATFAERDRYLGWAPMV